MSLTTHRVGIIMNGVTGRMGTNQHLLRSIVAIIKQGGVKVSPTEVIMPDPILVGRNPVKLEKLAELSGVSKYTTNVEEALGDSSYGVYFDSQTTLRRVAAVKQAIEAGKHIYIEKPIAHSLESAMELYELAKSAGVKHGVVQDKLWLPGMLKLKLLKDTGFFGDIITVRGEFGYWVFAGDFDRQPGIAALSKDMTTLEWLQECTLIGSSSPSGNPSLATQLGLASTV